MPERRAASILTLVMPYYENGGMLGVQFRNWLGWPPEYRDRLEVIVVDDGSTTSPAIDVPRPPQLPRSRIYRVLEDRPWHQHAARNLGAYVADAGWMLLTDMDHVLTADAAGALFKLLDAGALDDRSIYTLDRIEADSGLPTLGVDRKPKPHPNSFLVTRETFWRIGGYDEDFCGVYGTDGLFRARAFERATRAHLRGVALTRYWRDLVADASTTTLPRKEGRDPGAKARIVAAKAARGETGVVKVLQFPWERVL